MQVGPYAMIAMDYSLRLDFGEVVDSSDGKGPLPFRLPGEA
jgi:FKBP-type peptidyl-prolyl cis-trans isomerase 2